MRFGFGRITPIVKYLLIINVVVYLTMVLVPSAGEFIYSYFFLKFPGTENFVVTQFVTHMFVHFPDGNYPVHYSIISRHLIFNMFGLWVFGSMVEMVWGPKRFLNFYMACGIGAAAIDLLIMFLTRDSKAQFVQMGGASGAIYGVMVAAAYLFPNNVVNIYGIIPIKIKYLVILLVAVSLFMGIGGTHNGVAHWAHLGGAFMGAVFCFGGRLRRWMK